MSAAKQCIKIGRKGSFSTMDFVKKDENLPAHWYDFEGRQKHDERKANGRRLFAKYYDGLWD